MNHHPLKILYSDSAIRYYGQERYLHRLMRAMRDKGHTVEALCRPHADLTEILQADGFTVHTFPMASRWDFWRDLLPIKRLIQKRGFDVVNTNSGKDSIHVGVAAKLAKKPLIVRTRHLAKRIKSLASYNKIPHRVIAVGHYVQEIFIERGLNPDHIGVCYPAVTLPLPLPKQKLRSELGLSNNDIIIGSIGALRPGKGFDELIEATNPIIKENPKVHLVIMGEGNTRSKLERLINELNLANNVHLLGQRRDLPELIGDLSIFALASHTEATGTVFAEAAAAKLPTVGYRTTGVPNMLQDGTSGLLVPLKDVPALSDALQKLVNNPQLRHEMGQAGFQFAITEKRFTLDTLQAQTESYYQTWLEQIKS